MPAAAVRTGVIHPEVEGYPMEAIVSADNTLPQRYPFHPLPTRPFFRGVSAWMLATRLPVHGTPDDAGSGEESTRPV